MSLVCHPKHQSPSSFQCLPMCGSCHCFITAVLSPQHLDLVKAALSPAHDRPPIHLVSAETVAIIIIVPDTLEPSLLSSCCRCCPSPCGACLCTRLSLAVAPAFGRSPRHRCCARLQEFGQARECWHCLRVHRRPSICSKHEAFRAVRLLHKHQHISPTCRTALQT